MSKTVWQIRYLKESQWRSESEQILMQCTNQNDALKYWVENGYEKGNAESAEQTFGLFKVTYERLDNPNSNTEAVKERENYIKEFNERRKGRSKCEDCAWFNYSPVSKTVWCGKDNRGLNLDECQDYELNPNK